MKIPYQPPKFLVFINLMANYRITTLRLMQSSTMMSNLSICESRISEGISANICIRSIFRSAQSCCSFSAQNCSPLGSTPQYFNKSASSMNINHAILTGSFETAKIPLRTPSINSSTFKGCWSLRAIRFSTNCKLHSGNQCPATQKNTSTDYTKRTLIHPIQMSKQPLDQGKAIFFVYNCKRHDLRVEIN